MVELLKAPTDRRSIPVSCLVNSCPGLAVGRFLLRTKTPTAFAMTVCTQVQPAMFAHHILQAPPLRSAVAKGFTLNKKPLSKMCTTLEATIGYLKNGAGEGQRHPDIRITPTDAVPTSEVVGDVTL